MLQFSDQPEISFSEFYIDLVFSTKESVIVSKLMFEKLAKMNTTIPKENQSPQNICTIMPRMHLLGKFYLLHRYPSAVGKSKPELNHREENNSLCLFNSYSFYYVSFTLMLIISFLYFIATMQYLPLM